MVKQAMGNTAYNQVGCDKFGTGQNATEAVMSFNGYDFEDAIVMNKSSVDRGFGRCIVMKKSSAMNQKYENIPSDRIIRPQREGRDSEKMQGHRLENSKCKLPRELKLVENRFLLTGTPLLNNLAELWSLLNFILPDIFSSHKEFESWFDLSGKCNNEAMKEELEEKRKAQVVAKLHAILRCCLLPRMRSDVELMLPRQKEILLYATMTEHQKNLKDHLINKTPETYLQEKVDTVNSGRNAIKGLCISAPGGKMDFLMRTKKGLRTSCTFGSLAQFARDCLPTCTGHPMLCTGMPLNGLGYKREGLLLVHRLLAQLSCTLGRAPPFLNVGTVFVEPSAFPANALFMFSGLRHLGSAGDFNHQLIDQGKRKGPWSLLPVLLLWMIKDKLDIFDNIRFATVCRDWWSASASYPKRLQSVGDDGFPWIFQAVGSDLKSSLREFISITRKRKFTIDLPEFIEAWVLFSKHGWILLRRQNFSKPNKRLPDSLFLVNPFTKDKINLPDVVNTHIYAGSFSTLDGYPHRVVLLEHGTTSPVTIRIAYPGDQVWTDHTYLGQRTIFKGCSNFIIMGQHVYCHDTLGRTIIYNMASNSWKEFCVPVKGVFISHITEHNGEIIRIERDGRYNYFSSCEVFRYNDADTAWERLDYGAVEDTSWFLCKLRNCFSTKGKGVKVYTLCKRQGRLGIHCPPDSVVVHDRVVVHDLITASTQALHIPCPVHSLATWVDIA